MSDLKSTLKFIQTEADQQDLALILQTFRQRQRVLSQQRASQARRSLQPGDEVMLDGLKPKYLNGLRGKVMDITEKGPRVDLGRAPSRRFSQLVVVPFACAIKVG